MSCVFASYMVPAPRLDAFDEVQESFKGEERGRDVEFFLFGDPGGDAP